MEYFEETFADIALVSALERIRQLENAVKKHRDQKGDDRCYLDDLELYKVLYDNVEPDLALPSKEVFLKNCERYFECRKNPNAEPIVDNIQGRWMTRLELLEIEQMKRKLKEYDNKG